MRAWSLLRQLLAATLCAVLVAPAYPSASTLPRSSSTPSHTYDAATLSKTRVWGSSEKILLHFSAVLLLSEKQHWGSAKCSCKIVVGSLVTYDYDAFGNLLHSTATGIPPGGTSPAPTPNEFLFAGEQFDSDLNLYYNRARYLNTSTGRFWSADPSEGSPADPQTLHRYLYTSGDPTDSIDPTGLYTQSFGFDVEEEVEKQYELSHPGDVVSYGRWARLPGGYRLKPDILNFTELKYQEIKPISIGGVISGLAQMGIYYLAFSPSGFSPDTVWYPPSQPFVVQDTPVAVINAEGILFYNDAIEILKEAATLVTVAAVRQILITLGGKISEAGQVRTLAQTAIRAIQGMVADIQASFGAATVEEAYD
jgi:RHS repeat-associated protein